MASTSRATTSDPLRASILDAVAAIISLEGFEGATFRRVAFQAGCSAGAVQKRFASRSALLRAAFEHVVAQALERGTTSIDDGADSLLQRQRRGVRDTLPLDDVRRSEAIVWTSYVLRAAVDDTLGDLPRRVDRVVHESLAEQLRQAQATGELGRHADPDALADAIIALADGLAIRMLYTPASEQPAQLAALDAGLAALLSA